MASLILLSSTGCEDSPLGPEPNVKVKVWALDGSSLVGHNIVLEIGQDVQKSIINTEGIAGLVVPDPLPLGKSVRLYIDAVNTASRIFHPSLLIQGLSDTLNIAAQIKAVMVPLHFNITFGPYNGQRIEVSATKALTEISPQLPFPSFYVHGKLIAGIPANLLPLRVGITGGMDIDREFFWAILQNFEGAIWPQSGGLFARVPFETLPTGQGLRIRIGFSSRNHFIPYFNFFSVNDEESILNIHGGEMDLTTLFVSNRQVAGLIKQRELMKMLAFGKTNLWRGIASFEEMGSTYITAHDVAYIRMMHLAYYLATKYEIPPTNIFLAASRGETVFGR